MIDNGGAEAIKGFNFQKANLILLAIDNYEKSNFKIYIEAEDDIVVSFENYKSFIQVKKQSHTFNSLLKRDKKKRKNKDGIEEVVEKLSILEKNLSAGEVGDIYKIFVKDIGITDKKSLNIKKPGNICLTLYELSNQAKTDILSKLPDKLKNKLDNFFLYISPISEDFIEAEKYLIGCLNRIDIAVDNNQGRTIIAEISLTIDQKAQHNIEEISQKELKYMDSKYFSNVFVTCKALNKFENVLDSLNYNDIKKSRIKKERLKIDLTKLTLKDNIKKYINHIENLEELSNLEIVNLVLQQYLGLDENNLLIAIAIECICEIGEH